MVSVPGPPAASGPGGHDNQEFLRQRRNFVRLRREVEVRVRPLDGAGATLVATTLDLSLGGVRVAIKEEIAPQTAVELTFIDTGAALEVTVVGMLVWSTWSPQRLCFEAGVSLSSLSAEQSQNVLSVFGEGSGPERREYVRFEKHLVVELRREHDLLGRRVLASTCDISLGGMAVSAERPLKLHGRYWITVFLRGDSEALSAEATVLHCDRHGEGPPYGARIRFEGLADEERKRLGRFLGAEMAPWKP